MEKRIGRATSTVFPSPEEVGKFSGRDAAAIGPYTDELQTIADAVRVLMLETPPNIGEGSWRDALPELIKSAALGDATLAGVGKCCLNSFRS